MYGKMTLDTASGIAETAAKSLSGAAPGLDRRGFLTFAVGTGTGLALGLFADADGNVISSAAAQGLETVRFNPFVRITRDNRVIVIVKHLDKGQGAATGLATLVAEELDAAPGQIAVEFAPADASLYQNLFFGTMGTGGSTAMANSWVQYRTAGAQARAMIVKAAADLWKVAPGEVRVEQGIVRAGTRTAALGDLAAEAARVAVPAEVVLKAPGAWVYIGKRFPRVDQVAKSSGKPIFTQDVRLPGMMTAVIARPPQFGAKVDTVDARAARQVKGVADVVILPDRSGVGVIASSTWAAIKGRTALRVSWQSAKAETRGTADLLTAYRRLAAEPGRPAKSIGNAEQALKSAAKVIEAEYVFPYLAHAPMEPMNAVIEHVDGRVTIWTGSQLPNVDQAVAGSILGVRPEHVAINTLWAGGSFGRRAVPTSDYVAEAALLLKGWGKPGPLKLVWTREDDIQGGYYRPMMLHKVRAGLDAAGRLTGWHHRVVGQPILIGTPFEALMVKGGIDPTMTEGIADTLYDIPNLQVEQAHAQVGVPVLWWRSVGHTHTAYVVETMMDELAEAAGKDPLEFRLSLLATAPRHAAVLKLAAEKAGWGKPLPAGTSRGIAVHESFRTHVAEVAEVRMVGGLPKVERVVCAVDCGVAVNPDVIASQMEGGIGYGLGAVLKGKVTLEAGKVVQSNFDGYEVLRMDEMPTVEVHIVPSTVPPTGVGEPGTPPIGPAVANAIAAATGQRVRTLPMTDGLRKPV